MENIVSPAFFGNHIVHSEYLGTTLTHSIKEKFLEEGVVLLKNFFEESSIRKISLSVESEYIKRIRRDFVMEPYGSTRKMSVIGGSSLVNSNITLMNLYSNTTLRSAIERIVGEPIHTVSHKEEFMVVNFLDGDGDTHGWHLDDPKYALVVITEAPEGRGGNMEFISHWKKKYGSISEAHGVSAAVNIAKLNGDVKSLALESGDCYLINARDSLHRVTPIEGKGKRKALNMAFDDRRYQLFGDTATLLYGGS